MMEVAYSFQISVGTIVQFWFSSEIPWVRTEQTTSALTKILYVTNRIGGFRSLHFQRGPCY